MATPEELLKQQAEAEVKLGVTAAPIKEEVVSLVGLNLPVSKLAALSSARRALSSAALRAAVNWSILF